MISNEIISLIVYTFVPMFLFVNIKKKLQILEA